MLSGALLALTSCAPRKIAQDNYLIDASNLGGSNLAQSLATRLNTSLDSEDVTLPAADKYTLYRLDGEGFTLILNPLPDDRCNPNASIHSTFHEEEYQADLVYRTRSPSKRAAMRIALFNATNALGVPIEKFKNC